MQEILLQREAINKVDIKSLIDGIDTETRWKQGWIEFLYMSGQQHYRLLAYLSTFFDDELLLDIGTLTGASSIALSYNNKNRVVSFDLSDKTFSTDKKTWIDNNPEYDRVQHNISNIKYIIGDCLEHKNYLLWSSLIFLDIDHSGAIENKIIDFLKDNEWDGILLLDDISVMCPEVWRKIDIDKYDITKYGHDTGTGLVNFGDRFSFKLE